MQYRIIQHPENHLFHVQDKLISTMKANDIINTVRGYTEWYSLLIIVSKRDKESTFMFRPLSIEQISSKNPS